MLLHATQGIASLITSTGIINVDFADVRTVMQNGGAALMGTGIGRGENRALEAAQQAISSPLLDNVSIAGATGVLINIIGGDDLTLGETTQINDIIHDAVGDDAEIIFGAGNDAGHARRGPGHRHRHRLRPRRDRRAAARPGLRRGRRAQLPAAHSARLDSRHAGAAGRRAAAPRVPAPRCRRRRPPARPKCRRWRSPPSSGGRWTDAAAPARRWPSSVFGGRRRLRLDADAGPGAGCPQPVPPPVVARPDRRRRSPRRSTPCAAARRCPTSSPGTASATSTSPGSTPRSRSIRAGSAPGWSSASASTAADTLPSRDHRPHRPRSSGSSSTADRRRLERRRPSRSPGAPRTVRIEGAIDNSLYEALDAQVARRPARRRRPAAAGLGPGRRVRLAGGLHPRHPAGRPLPGGVRAAGLGGRRGPIRPRAGRATSRCPARASPRSASRRDGHAGLLRRRRQLASPGVPPGAGAVPPHLLHASPARGSIPSWASPGGTRAPTTPPRPARRSWPRATASCCGPAGPAGTAT